MKDTNISELLGLSVAFVFNRHQVTFPFRVPGMTCTNMYSTTLFSFCFFLVQSKFEKRTTTVVFSPTGGAFTQTFRYLGFRCS